MGRRDAGPRGARSASVRWRPDLSGPGGTRRPAGVLLEGAALAAAGAGHRRTGHPRRGGRLPLAIRIAATGADLGFIASAFVYDTVVKHGPGFVDPGTYRRVEITVKESTLVAWMHLAGGNGAVPAGRAEAGVRPAAGPSFNADVHVSGDLVLGNKIDYRSPPGPG